MLFKKKKNRVKPLIRPLKMSLKIKMVFLMVILLIFTVAVVSNFIINFEDGVLRKQLKQTMSGYLHAFEKNVEILLIDRSDGLVSLQDFTQHAFKSVPNFKMAMFVDSEGHIVTHSNPKFIHHTIAVKNIEMLQESYEQRLYLTNHGSIYDGFIPVYDTIAGGSFYKDRFSESGHLTTINLYLRLYQRGKLFKTAVLPDEVYHNFKLMRDFDRIYSRLKKDGEWTAKAKNLLKERQISSRDLAFLGKYERRFERVKDGREYELSDRDIRRLMDLLVLGGLDTKKATFYLELRDKKNRSLFSHTGLLNDEMNNNLKFLFFVESFVTRFMDDRGRPNSKMDSFLSLLEDRQVGQVKRSYWIKQFRILFKELKKLRSYRNEETLIGQSQLDKTFSALFGIYRMGSVRIVLYTKDIELERKQISNHTLDIAIMVILRVLFVTFVVVSWFIRPLESLSVETDRISHLLGGIRVNGTEEQFARSLNKLKDYLQRSIEIKGYDELGQLADEFNLMTRKFRQAFDEIQDKFRMGEELEHAKEIQDAILPHGFPDYPGYEFSVSYEPQSESGGDYYDFIEMDETRFGIVVADVTNHGVGAAMVMSTLRSTLRTFAGKRMDAAKVIKDINPILLRDTPRNMFATVFYSVMDIPNRCMYYSIAGHNQGVLYSPADKKLKLLKAGGMPVGMLDSAIFDPAIELFKVTFNKGDIFIQYSDGITEAKNLQDEEYGEDRFYEVIAAFYNEDLDVMRDAILKDVKAFRGAKEQTDDITLLIMKIG